MASNQPPVKLLLNVREAAASLGVCSKTIFNMVKAGDLRPVRIGSRVLFAVPDLEAFIQSAKGGER